MPLYQEIFCDNLFIPINMFDRLEFFFINYAFFSNASLGGIKFIPNLKLALYFKQMDNLI